MEHLKRVSLFVLLTFAPAASAVEIGEGQHIEEVGVIVDTKTLQDRVSFCIRAKDNVKISSMYGITFDTDHVERMKWGDIFPKTITGPGWDFDLPQRIELRTHVSPVGWHVRIQLGACSDRCNIVRFDVQSPPYKESTDANIFCSK